MRVVHMPCGLADEKKWMFPQNILQTHYSRTSTCHANQLKSIHDDTLLVVETRHAVRAQTQHLILATFFAPPRKACYPKRLIGITLQIVSLTLAME